jgi:hypothetical protein
MRRPKPQTLRNKLDLSDRVQVRLVKGRLRLTDAQLIHIVGRIGNSLSAISKEAGLRAKQRPEPELPVAVIASVTDTAITEVGTSEPVG